VLDLTEHLHQFAHRKRRRLTQIDYPSFVSFHLENRLTQISRGVRGNIDYAVHITVQKIARMDHQSPHANRIAYFNYARVRMGHGNKAGEGMKPERFHFRKISYAAICNDTHTAKRFEHVRIHFAPEAPSPRY
jgi:hypothetical protein